MHMNHPLALHYNNYYYIDTYASGSWGRGGERHEDHEYWGNDEDRGALFV